MIKVKMKTTTAGHLKGKEYLVLDETAKRWESKGIASISGKASKPKASKPKAKDDNPKDKDEDKKDGVE